MRRRSPEAIAALAVRVAVRVSAACASKRWAGGVGAAAVARSLRSTPRSLRPAFEAAIAAGAIRRTGSGRGTLYLPSTAPEGEIEALARKAGEGRASALAARLGVSRRTLLRWQRLGRVPEFHKLRMGLGPARGAKTTAGR